MIGRSDHQSNPARRSDETKKGVTSVVPHFAPFATHVRSVCFSSAERGGRFWGMASDSIISISELSSGLPGIRTGPLLPPARAPTSFVRLSSPLRSEPP